MIHPGDVRIVTAIGRPPPGSPFEKEPLPNAVVFSVKGRIFFFHRIVHALKKCFTGGRPITSMMGGGDLDGDTVSNLTAYDLSLFPLLENSITSRYEATFPFKNCIQQLNTRKPRRGC